MHQRITRVVIAAAAAAAGLGAAPGLVSPASAACPGGALLHAQPPFVGTAPPQVHTNYVCFDVAGNTGHVIGAVVVPAGPSYGVYADAYTNLNGADNYTGANEATVTPGAGVAGCALNVGAPTSPCEVPGLNVNPSASVRILGTRYV
jgi:hypothetical protein